MSRVHVVAAGILLAVGPLLADDVGGVLFKAHCAPCHGDKGDGGRGANLARRRLPHAPDDGALGSIIANGIPGTQMPATRMTDDERRQLVQYVRTLGLAAAPAEAVSGDRARGEQTFWSKGNCGQCHTVGARGGRIGPDLTDVGSHRSASYLKTSILDPEAEVPEIFSFYRKTIYVPDAYVRVRAVTKDGKQLSGTRVDEDTFTIQFRDDSDHIYSFKKDELKELHKDWGKSPMPSYAKVLTAAEVNDVVAYLTSLVGEP
jgi:putative heme-binding domain-containing protein